MADSGTVTISDESNPQSSVRRIKIAWQTAAGAPTCEKLFSAAQSSMLRGEVVTAIAEWGATAPTSAATDLVLEDDTAGDIDVFSTNSFFNNMVTTATKIHEGDSRSQIMLSGGPYRFKVVDNLVNDASGTLWLLLSP